MSVAQILEQLAANAGRAPRARAALIGGTIADISTVPAQIIADRERQQIVDAQRARLAAQDARAVAADARAAQDQTLQNEAAVAAAKRQQVLQRGIAAGFADDPHTFDLDKGVASVIADGMPDLAVTLRDVHAKFQPAKVPTREVRTRNADGSETVRIVPDQPGEFTSAPPPAPPPKPERVVVPGPDGKPITKFVTPEELKAGVPTYERPRETPPPGAEVIKLTPSGIDIAALNYKKTGVMPPLGMGDRSNRQQIINRAAELTAEDIARIEAGGGDIATNKGSFAADSASLRDLTKVLDASTAFSNTMHDNFALMKQAAKDIVDTGSPWLNQPLRVVAGKLAGSPAQSAFDTYRAVVVPEAAKILSSPTASGQLTDSARKEMEAIVSGSGTLKQLISVADALEKDASNKRRNYQAQIDAVKKRMSGNKGTTADEPPPVVAPPRIRYDMNGNRIGG